MMIRCAKHHLGQGLDIIGRNEIAPLRGSEGLSGAVEPQRTAWAGAQKDIRIDSRGLHHRDDVRFDERVHVHILDLLLSSDQIGPLHHLLQRVQRMYMLLRIEDRDLFTLAGVTQRDPHQKAIQLSLGQRKRALVLDRVLRRQHQKRLGKPICVIIDRNLAFLHAFEQGRLRLGGRTIDLVREDDLRHDRPRSILKLARLLAKDGNACDVTRQQVWRELDPAKARPDGTGQRLGQHGLANTRHILNQNVSLAQHRHDGQSHLSMLADDHLFDVADNPVGYFLNSGHLAHLSDRYVFG